MSNLSNSQNYHAILFYVSHSFTHMYKKLHVHTLTTANVRQYWMSCAYKYIVPLSICVCVPLFIHVHQPACLCIQCGYTHQIRLLHHTYYLTPPEALLHISPNGDTLTFLTLSLSTSFLFPSLSAVIFLPCPLSSPSLLSTLSSLLYFCCYVSTLI